MEKVRVVQMAAIGRSRVGIESNGNGVAVGKIPDLDDEVTSDD
jgi:hypothetical protein